MEPLDDNELKQLLRKWEAPPAPGALAERVLRSERPWWKWLFTGSIRVPVPVALAAALLFALWITYSKPSTPRSIAQPNTVSLADFQPVQQLQPVVVVGGTR